MILHPAQKNEILQLPIVARDPGNKYLRAHLDVVDLHTGVFIVHKGVLVVYDTTYTVFPVLYDERGGLHCFSKPPRPKYAEIATK